MKTTIVYWAVYSNLELQTRQNLAMKDIESIRKNLASKINSTNNKSSYMACASYHEYFKNTYLLKHPYTTEWQHNTKNNRDLFNSRPNDSAFINSHLVDYDLQWIFFSEDDVELETTPAFFHQKESDKYGHIVAGSFNISKWFRPISLSWQLWENVNEIKFKEDDAIAYLKFKTKNKIKLQRFEMTQKLEEIVNGCTSVKQVLPNLPLTELYERFTKSNRKKIIMREINVNL